MKVISNSIVRTALVAWATACPALAAPRQQLGDSAGAQTGATLQAPDASTRQTVQKSLVPLAPPNPIPISSLPVQISQSGYYRVTQDLTGVAGFNGILVFDADVVIDLDGFTLSGVPGSLNAINGGHRLIVLGGAILGWGGTGVTSAGTTSLYGLEISHNQGDGAAVGPRSLVQDCSIHTNDGSGITGGSFVITVIDCSVSTNGADGIRGMDDWLVKDCLVSNNGDDGMDLGDRSRVIGCRMLDNGNSGLEAKARTLVSDTTASGNSSGFLLGASSRIERCFAHDNFSGIIADEACHVIDCTATSNALHGITGLEGTLIQRCIVSANQRGIILFQKGCRVSDCKIESNVDDGLGLSGNSTAERNSVQGNGSRGIFAASTGNRIDGNDVADNGVGIAVLAGNNLIVRNTLAFNGVHLQIAADNHQGPFIKAKGFIQNTNPWANFDLSFPTTFP